MLRVNQEEVESVSKTHPETGKGIRGSLKFLRKSVVNLRKKIKEHEYTIYKMKQLIYCKDVHIKNIKASGKRVISNKIAVINERIDNKVDLRTTKLQESMRNLKLLKQLATKEKQLAKTIASTAKNKYLDKIQHKTGSGKRNISRVIMFFPPSCTMCEIRTEHGSLLIFLSSLEIFTKEDMVLFYGKEVGNGVYLYFRKLVKLGYVAHIKPHSKKYYTTESGKLKVKQILETYTSFNRRQNG